MSGCLTGSAITVDGAGSSRGGWSWNCLWSGSGNCGPGWRWRWGSSSNRGTSSGCGSGRGVATSVYVIPGGWVVGVDSVQHVSMLASTSTLVSLRVVLTSDSRVFVVEQVESGRSPFFAGSGEVFDLEHSLGDGAFGVVREVGVELLVAIGDDLERSWKCVSSSPQPYKIEPN